MVTLTFVVLSLSEVIPVVAVAADVELVAVLVLAVLVVALVVVLGAANVMNINKN